MGMEPTSMFRHGRVLELRSHIHVNSTPPSLSGGVPDSELQQQLSTTAYADCLHLPVRTMQAQPLLGVMDFSNANILQFVGGILLEAGTTSRGTGFGNGNCNRANVQASMMPRHSALKLVHAAICRWCEQCLLNTTFTGFGSKLSRSNKHVRWFKSSSQCTAADRLQTVRRLSHLVGGRVLRGCRCSARTARSRLSRCGLPFTGNEYLSHRLEFLEKQVPFLEQQELNASCPGLSPWTSWQREFPSWEFHALGRPSGLFRDIAQALASVICLR